MMNKDVDCLDELVVWYETLSPASLAQLPAFYAGDAHFVDPFNDVRGPAAIARIFEHMFRTLDAPHFVVHTRTRGEGCAMLAWRFSFVLRGRPFAIEGSTLLRFAPDGKVAEHLDYWDPAKEVYGSLPLLGPLLRAIARRMAAA